MRHGHAAVALIGCLALTAGGCGDDPNADGPTASLSVTRDFGRAQLPPRTAQPVESHRSVMKLLRADHEVGTHLDGRVVDSIDGVRQRRNRTALPSGAELVWVYYVNGFDADEFAPDYRLFPGDAVQWDLRPWDVRLSVRATVGAFPETFTGGMYGRRFPVTVECDRHSRAACARVRGVLGRAGVATGGERPPGPRPRAGSPQEARVLVGRWDSFRDRTWPKAIDLGPDASGVFARFSPDGRAIHLLDGHVRRTGSVGAGSGMVAAMRPTEEDVVWVVTGVDDEGVARAARALNRGDLRDAYAVVVTREGIVRVPTPPRKISGARGPRLASDGGPPPSPQSELREAAAYAPLMQLDRREPWRPVEAKELLRWSTLRWAGRIDCDDRNVATGLHVARSQRRNRAVDITSLWGLGRGPIYWRSPRELRTPADGTSPTGDPCITMHDGRSYATDVTRPHEWPGRRGQVPITSGFYADIDDGWLKRVRGGRPTGGRARIYVERRVERGPSARRIRLSYWTLFPRETSAHEGDWERMDVVLTRGGSGKARPTELVLYGRDGSRRVVPWSAVRRAGEHPVVVNERGAHTLSTAPCASCRRWRTWDALAIARNQPWYGFGGAWGAVGDDSATTGPLGPRGLPLLPIASVLDEPGHGY